MHPMIEIIIIRYCHQLSAGEALQSMKHNATISVKRKATATAAFFHFDEICLPISEMSICYLVNRVASVSPSVAPRIVIIMIQSVYTAKLMGGVISKYICIFF